MNYITTLNFFWKLQGRLHLNSNEIALYTFLLNSYNSLRWSRDVSHPNSFLCKRLQISEHTLIRCRLKLVEHGLISFTPGNNRHHISRYSITDNSNLVTMIPADSTTAPADPTTAASTANNGACTAAKNNEAATAIETDSNKKFHFKSKVKIWYSKANEKSGHEPSGESTNKVNLTKQGILEFIKEFNEKCRSQKKITKLDKWREKLLNDCLEEFGAGCLENIISKVAASNFLAGENRYGWIAQFDWIFNPVNTLKIIDGHYDNDAKASPFNPTKASPIIEAEEARKHIFENDPDFKEE